MQCTSRTAHAETSCGAAAGMRCHFAGRLWEQEDCMTAVLHIRGSVVYMVDVARQTQSVQRAAPGQMQ